MKINLGCGNKKLDGFINVDIAVQCKPDLFANLEQTPWPFCDNSAEQVNMENIIEHIGATTNSHKKIIQELYRICVPKAVVRVTFPHPRSAAFLIDPTHVRAITVSTFEMYSKKKCQISQHNRQHSTLQGKFWRQQQAAPFGSGLLDFKKTGFHEAWPVNSDRFHIMTIQWAAADNRSH